MNKKLALLGASLLVASSALAQTAVKGRVLDKDGHPVIGAAVKVGSKTLAVTDEHGNFSVSKLPAGTKQVVVSYIGMTPQTVSVSGNMNVTLRESDTQLDDVVVVAYGKAKRQSITGSVTVVDAKNIEKRLTTSVTGALEGTAPGVQVNNTYGEPGAAPKINIRGIGTLVKDADQPLYIVDGVAFDGNIAELNPNDIESLSVLKDASSAALYGNRAANGVVIVTTKKAKSNLKPTLSAKVDFGTYTRGLPEYERLGINDWMQASWYAMKNFAKNGSQKLSEEEARSYATSNLISAYARRNVFMQPNDKLFDAAGKFIGTFNPNYTDLDWYDVVERTGQRRDYNVSGGVGNDKFNVYASLGYLNEKGYTLNSAYERFSGRVNASFKPTKWLEWGTNLNAVVSTRDFNGNAEGNAFANPFFTVRYMAPIYPYYKHNTKGEIVMDENGAPVWDTESPYLSNRNIAYELRSNHERTKRNVIDGQAFARITLPYGFSVSSRINANYSNSSAVKFGNPKIGDGAANNGRFTRGINEYLTYTGQQLINWERKFDVHNVDVLLGHENYNWDRDAMELMNTNMAVPDVFTLSNFQKNSFSLGAKYRHATESYFFRARYNYDERYFADFSFRRDASSKFHKDKRWGNFFSFGLNWNLKREEFLKNVDWVNLLRARASYGEVGNDAAATLYAYQALYAVEKNGGNPAYIRKSLAANDLKWETTQTIDFGVEARLFDRLNVNLGYFNKRSKDLLFEVRLPASGGAYVGNEDFANPSKLENIGTISNSGFELAINGDIVSTPDWTWNLGLDATTLSNEVVKLPGGKDILHGQQQYSEGHSAYEWYTFHFEGVDQLTGRSLYTLDPKKKAEAQKAGKLATINGKDYALDTSHASRHWAGTVLPSVYGSITSNLRWRDLSLNVLLTYSLGGKGIDGSYQSLMSTGSAASASAMHKDILNSWMAAPEGMKEDSPNRIDPNGLPLIDFETSIYNNALSDRWLVSRDYLVLKNITLNYRLPKQLVSQWGISGLSVRAGVENLFTLTARQGYNPQFSFKGGSDDTYVTARVFSCGLTLDF